MRVFKLSVEENIHIVELRHIIGFMFDSDRKALETRKEMEIFD
jgi:hypothetical protein